MLVITQDTDAAFNREIEYCLQKNESWRCMAFKFSDVQKLPDNWFSEITEKISYCLGESNGRIFLFPDNDVFVLSRHANQRSFLYLLTHLQPPLAPVPLKGLASLHEIPVDIQAIKNLRGHEKDKEKKEEKIENPVLYIDSLHQPLLSTIADRRSRKEKPSILIVEDDPFSQRLVGKSLESNFDIFMASSGQEALHSYIRHAPHIIFLDIGLPDSSGLDVLLKIFEADPHAYIIMLSGNGSHNNVVKAISNGAKGFVAKPFARDKLVHYIVKCPYLHETHRKNLAEMRN